VQIEKYHKTIDLQLMKFLIDISKIGGNMLRYRQLLEARRKKMTSMNYSLLILLLYYLTACNQTPSFQFDTTSSHRLDEIIKWNNRIIVTDNTGELYEIIGDTLTKFRQDSIISVKQCKDGFYILKAPNDSILVMDQPNGSKLTIANKTGNESRYFSVWLNERCNLLLECGGIAYPIQQNSLVDSNKIYGFAKNTKPSGSDRAGFFENFIFLTKYPDFLGGAFFMFYLDSLGNRYSLPENLKVRDFTLHKDELWLVTGFYQKLEDKEIIDKHIIKLRNGKIDEALTFETLS
jgi:hypothetical protein